MRGQLALGLERPADAPDTSYVVTQPLAAPTPIFWFVAYLSPYAPGCAELPVGDDRGWFRRGNVPAPRALAELLARIGARPDEVEFRSIKSGDVAVIQARDGAPRVPLAFIVEGATADQAAAIAARLAGAPNRLGDRRP